MDKETIRSTDAVAADLTKEEAAVAVCTLLEITRYIEKDLTEVIV